MIGILLSSQLALSEVEFHRDVMPLIAANCVVCHSNDGVSFPFEDADETYMFRAVIAFRNKWTWAG